MGSGWPLASMDGQCWLRLRSWTQLGTRAIWARIGPKATWAAACGLGPRATWAWAGPKVPRALGELGARGSLASDPFQGCLGCNMTSECVAGWTTTSWCRLSSFRQTLKKQKKNRGCRFERCHELRSPWLDINNHICAGVKRGCCFSLKCRVSTAGPESPTF